MINKRVRNFVLLFFIVSGVFLSTHSVLADCVKEGQNFAKAKDSYIGCLNRENNEPKCAVLKQKQVDAEATLNKCTEAAAAAAKAQEPTVAKDPSNVPPATAQAAAVPAVITTTLNVPLGKISEFTVGGNILGLYLQYWYGFLIGTIGILATIMIMYGGFLYLTSAGDKGKAGEGQKIITSAVTGIVVAFGVYTILYLINPNLLTINIPSIGSISTEAFNLPSLAGSHGSPRAGGPVIARPSNTCTNNGNSLTVNFDQMSNNQISGVTEPNCSFLSQLKWNSLTPYDEFFSTYGGANAHLLKAIAMAESEGNPNAISPAGACGLMQFMPKTASSLNKKIGGEDLTCEQLQKDPELSIKLAAQYLAEGANLGNKGSDLIAGYNGGYSTQGGAALSRSVDCGDNFKAYQCCKNAGGLAETQDYVPKVNTYLNCYNKQ